MMTATTTTTNAKVEEFRSIMESVLMDIAVRTTTHNADADADEQQQQQRRCLILSGGVDTCAILAAARKLGISFAAAITVVCSDKTSPDLDFAKAAATAPEHHNMTNRHHIIKMTPDALISNYLTHCVKFLYTFDGMTLRNSLIIAAAFDKAAELGMKHVIVGDGADELFGGYSFMWGDANNSAQWKKRRDEMCQQWTFATAALARSFGLESHSPYTEPNMVKWALKNTTRDDCIGTRPIRLVYQGETQSHVTGKLILREAYHTVASWRQKDPIEVGSGITVIGKNEFWDDKIPDDEFNQQVETLKTRGFVVKSKEYLFNFRVFEFCFGKNGEKHPKKKRLAIGQGCAGCCFEIGDKMFCDVCGAFPAQRSS